MKIKSYLLDTTVAPRTRSCRVKVWAHDNAFTLLWLTGINMVGWVVTVITCQG